MELEKADLSGTIELILSTTVLELELESLLQYIEGNARHHNHDVLSVLGSRERRPTFQNNRVL